MNLKIAINPSHVNKMPVLTGAQMKNWWREFNGNFKNVNIPIEEFIKAIQGGLSYTAQHRSYRKASNFISGQHIGLDFDTDDFTSSINDLSDIQFIRDHAAFVHTTASHTDEHPRARVIFILPFAFRDVRRYSVLTEAFAHMFGHADHSCSDPVRLFFGAKDCEVNVLGNVLPLELVKEIATKYVAQRNERKKPAPQNITVNGSISRIMHTMLSNLANTPDGQKWYQLGKTSRAMGGYIAGGYIDETAAFDVLFQAISPRVKDIDVAEDRISWGLRVGQSDPIYLEEDLDPIMQHIMG